MKSVIKREDSNRCHCDAAGDSLPCNDSKTQTEPELTIGCEVWHLHALNHDSTAPCGSSEVDVQARVG